MYFLTEMEPKIDMMIEQSIKKYLNPHIVDLSCRLVQYIVLRELSKQSTIQKPHTASQGVLL
jgi:hypothetical protein